MFVTKEMTNKVVCSIVSTDWHKYVSSSLVNTFLSLIASLSFAFALLSYSKEPSKNKSETKF